MTTENIRQAYQAAAGRWTGCDWPTCFGHRRLDLNGLSSEQARARARAAADAEVAGDWLAAAEWLEVVERRAEEAGVQVALALASANAGDLAKALCHARRARDIEAAARPRQNDAFSTWEELARSVEHEVRAEGQAHVAEPPTALDRLLAQVASLNAEVGRLTALAAELGPDDRPARRPSSLADVG